MALILHLQTWNMWISSFTSASLTTWAENGKIQGTLFESTPVPGSPTSVIYTEKVQQKLYWEENRLTSTGEGNSTSIISIVVQKKGRASGEK